MTAFQFFATIAAMIRVEEFLRLPVVSPAGAAPFPDVAAHIQRATPGGACALSDCPGMTHASFRRVVVTGLGSITFRVAGSRFPLGFSGQAPGLTCFQRQPGREGQRFVSAHTHNGLIGRVEVMVLHKSWLSGFLAALPFPTHLAPETSVAVTIRRDKGQELFVGHRGFAERIGCETNRMRRTTDRQAVVANGVDTSRNITGKEGCHQKIIT